ncbi:MAG: hypothetical protein JWM11_4276 [Planctomycetaceae bacterium]|nr:hypothetical protein [Planctomycetaceae bacterium]
MLILRAVETSIIRAAITDCRRDCYAPRKCETPLACQALSRTQFARLKGPSRGAVVVWILPMMAILALASYLWLAPGPRRPISAAEISELEDSAARTENLDSQAADITGSLRQLTTLDVTASSVEKQLEGEWTGYYQGQRRLIVRADGTCTMTAEPEGLAAALLAAKLTFEIQWKMNGEHMEFKTIGGQPLDKVKIVLRMYGSRRSHKILKLESDDLVLLDEDGVTKYEWRRVSDELNADVPGK